MARLVWLGPGCVAALGVVGLACGRGPAPSPAPVPAPPVVASASCQLMAPPTAAPDSLRIAVTDSIVLSTNADARNPGERFVLAQTDRALKGDCSTDSVVRYTIEGEPTVEEPLRLTAPGRPTLVVLQVDDRHALDLLDGGIDMVLTDRPAVVRYAATRAGYVLLPLPWDRLYAFVGPRPVSAIGAVEAVRADARLPGLSTTTCTTPGDTSRAEPATKLAYLRDDSIARALAERLVALSPGMRAWPVPRRRFAQELAADALKSYVIALPARDTALCAAVERVVPAPRVIIPLVETRAHLIVRRGAIGIAADSLGEPRIEVHP